MPGRFFLVQEEGNLEKQMSLEREKSEITVTWSGRGTGEGSVRTISKGLYLNCTVDMFAGPLEP